MFISDTDYLKLFKINEDKYLIGIFQDGITVHKQQVRALNIFHALYNTKLKYITDPNFKIGVIGAGIAGLTFAAAALKANFQVILMEKQPVYLHMQFGCDIRRIHPNLYEWPKRNYNNPYAEMPILDWKHDSASNVVKQIIIEWEKIKNDAVKKNKKGFKRLVPINNCVISTIQKTTVAKNQSRFEIKYKSDEASSNEYCDLLIFATGYGVEKGVKAKAKTPSYWRNDSYSQIDLSDTDTTYIISGVGDGGLIDLFRLKIFDFSYELILDIIEKSGDFADLLPLLNEVQESIQNGEFRNETDLFTSFKLIDSDFYNYIFEALKIRNLIRNNTVWLNDSKPDFPQTLDYKKLSFLHAFLIFILMEHGPNINLSYVGGKLDYDGSNRAYTIDNVVVPKNSQVIIRHGTEREKSIPEKYFSEAAKDLTLVQLKKIQELTYNYGKVDRRWSNSELNTIFKPNKDKKYEYLNPGTTVLCTNFISGLANIIGLNIKNEKLFRISLHRIIYVKGAYFFQQITSYFGNQPINTKEKFNDSLGQVFEISRGNVGLSFKTGKPVLITNNNEQEFSKLVKAMDLFSEFDKISINKTYCTFPILAKHQPGNNIVTNLVLFIDSIDPNLFGLDQSIERKNIFNLIEASITGFVESINYYVINNFIKMVDVDFEPLSYDENFPTWLTNNCCFHSDPFPTYTENVDDSKSYFNNFNSFNLIN